MANLRNANFVDPPTSVLSLAQLVGIIGPVSVRELIVLLGERQFGPRPFYVISHNPDSITDVTQALADGANAIGPDLNVFMHHPDQISVSHGRGKRGVDPPLVEYLQALHDIVAENQQLTLVVFDCKEPVTTANHGLEILNAIRTYLTFDNNLNIILSVAKLAHSALFDHIHSLLGPREGLMIDAEDDPTSVTELFSNMGVDHQCYGNGSIINSVFGPFYRPTLEWACELKARRNQPRFVEAWTVNDSDDLREYIRIGVDGIISDEVATLNDISQEAEFNMLIRRATRDDNPFMPANYAYGLSIHTGDVLMAGTDANLTFTLTGTLGTASKTVDANLINRMEQSSWSSVTIPSPDIGDLQSITVERDNKGNAPDWFLDRIVVRSFRFGVSKHAIFNRWIDTTSLYTQALIE